MGNAQLRLMNLSCLDINDTEQELLTALIHNQPATATQLIELTGMHRKVVYDALKRLEHQTLILSEKAGKERHYVFGGRTALEQRKQELTEKHQKTIKELTTLQEALKKLPPTDSIESYALTGVQGVRYALTQLLELNQDYCVIGAPVESESIMGETFWLNFHRKQEAQGIRVKALFNPSLAGWQEKANNKNVIIRHFELIEPLTELIICDEYVFSIIWTRQPRVHVIKSNHYANTQRTYFDMLWKHAQ